MSHSARYLRSLRSASSLPSGSALSPSRTIPGANDRAFVEHLNGVFPELQFPPELARRILTHGSHPTAINGHNAGMSFLGRRVLESYLLLFLQSSKALQPNDNIDAIITRTIGSYTLGDHIGRRWGLGRGMRWTPAAPARRLAEDREASMVSVGLYKVQGDAVAAVMGGIFHQFGATVAHRVFHTRVLPYLENLPEQFIADAQSICERMGGTEGKLLLDNATPTAEPVAATN
ncbi:ribonuclease-III-like-domain-containing protein [Crucibulum laeve]|uniref:Ribonuclease-III-like-domain-containing protein n=1 Tax=Crucibulum laeve TaxID=68775 RepID=A0A5C3LM88_9AGAR|nr:ribonuclease-III-like-domain-containing protein [Crucibulum laeve]